MRVGLFLGSKIAQRVFAAGYRVTGWSTTGVFTVNRCKTGCMDEQGHNAAVGRWLGDLRRAAGLSAQTLEDEYNAFLVKTQLSAEAGHFDASYVEFGDEGLDTVGRYIVEYRDAYRRAAPDLGTDSLLAALQMAYQYRDHRLFDIADLVEPTSVVVGRDLASNALVKADRLVIHRGPLAQFLTGAERELFSSIVVRVAQRHPLRALVPVSQVAASAALRAVMRGQCERYGSNVRGYGYLSGLARPEVFFDPIAGVQTLSGGLERAMALGADGDDVVALAWAILAANFHAYPPRKGITPINAWRRLADKAAFALDVQGSQDTANTVKQPDSKTITEVSERYLRRWHGLGSVTGSDVRIETPSVLTDPAKVWHGAVPENAGEPAGDRSAWVFDDSMFSGLPAAMAQRGVSALTLTASSVSIHREFPSELSWLPSRIDPRIGLVCNDTGTWQAVQLY